MQLALPASHHCGFRSTWHHQLLTTVAADALGSTSFSPLWLQMHLAPPASYHYDFRCTAPPVSHHCDFRYTWHHQDLTTVISDALGTPSFSPLWLQIHLAPPASHHSCFRCTRHQQLLTIVASDAFCIVSNVRKMPESFPL